MVVYLIHFSSPIEHAQHYLGWADDLTARINAHRTGRGARLTQVAYERGIEMQVARVWQGADRHFERRLKKCKNTPRMCPICNPGTADRMMTQ